LNALTLFAHDNHPNPKSSNTMKPAKQNSSTAKAAVKSALVPVAKPIKKTATSHNPARKGPPVTPQVAGEVTLVEIANRAYFTYVSAGRSEGQEIQHCLEAEAQLGDH